MKLSFAFHVLGIIFWMGGLLFGTKLVKVAAAHASNAAIQTLSKKTLFGYILPGLIVTLVTGLHQLVAGGVGVYMKQGWMHAKLTLIAFLLWPTIVMFIDLLSMSRGESVNLKHGTLHHAITSFCLLVILILTFVKPF